MCISSNNNLDCDDIVVVFKAN